MFFRKKYFFLLLCVLAGLLIVVAQLIANSMLLLLALAFYGAIVFFSAFADMSIPVLMFFLAWAPLIKLQPGMISMYTISILLVLLIYVWRGYRNISILYVLPLLLLVAETLTVKTIYNFPIVDNDYIFFCASLLLFPLLAKERAAKCSFYDLTIYFSCGIVLAALLAQQFGAFPTISRYMQVHAAEGIVRLAGFYGDPNFYSAHITAALSGVILLLLNEINSRRRFILLGLAAILLYCGFLGLAKSFALILVFIAIFTVLHILFQKSKISSKMLMILTLVFGSAFILSTTLFSDLVDKLLNRFLVSSENLSSLTTGRTDLWLTYLNLFESDVAIFWFGNGYSDILINDKSPHNTLIQIVYQVGIVGGILLLSWLYLYMKNVLGTIKLKFSTMIPLILLLIGTIGPWMALDILFFYEFFLIPYYICVGIEYLLDSNQELSRQ